MSALYNLLNNGAVLQVLTRGEEITLRNIKHVRTHAHVRNYAKCTGTHWLYSLSSVGWTASEKRQT